MSLIKFNNQNLIYENVNINKFGTNQIRLTFDSEIEQNVIVSGFVTLNENNGEIQGLYEDYNTIFREYDNKNIIELSNDNSIYVEPPVVDDPEEIHIPVLTLEEVKNMRINELSLICNSLIENGVDINIDNNIEHFSYKIQSGDQGNIDDLFNLAIASGLAQPYHCDGGNCKLYSVEQVIEIYITQKTNKASQTTYFNQLKQYILSLDNNDDVGNVNYGQELEGIYLETYNSMMYQSSLIINNIIAKNQNGVK